MGGFDLASNLLAVVMTPRERETFCKILEFLIEHSPCTSGVLVEKDIAPEMLLFECISCMRQIEVIWQDVHSVHSACVTL